MGADEAPGERCAYPGFRGALPKQAEQAGEQPLEQTQTDAGAHGRGELLFHLPELVSHARHGPGTWTKARREKPTRAPGHLRAAWRARARALWRRATDMKEE